MNIISKKLGLRNPSSILYCGIITLGLTSSLPGAVIVLQEGMIPTVDGLNVGGAYSATHDSWLQQGSPDTNHGNSTQFEVDGSPNQHGLLRFGDLSLATGQTIVSAQLTLNITNPGNDVTLVRLSETWDESTVTWNNFGDANNGISTNDYTSATTTFGAPTGSVMIDVTADIQAWAAGATNYGWGLLPTSGNGVDIRSSENGTVTLRPILTITTIPEPTSAILATLGSCLFLLRRSRK